MLLGQTELLLGFCPVLDQEGARKKTAQVENHYLWTDDSKLSKTTEVMSSLTIIVVVLCAWGAVALMYNSE